MSSIYLVRHGQASFGKEDYDQLSEKGFQQGACLAQHFQRVTPTELVSGNMLRHQQTADAYRTAAQVTLPVYQDAGFNEFDHMDVIHVYKPAWRDRGQMMQELATAPDPRKAFQKRFAEAIVRWADGAHDAEYVESWQAFRARVLAAFQRVLDAAGSGREVIVFSSGGPISVICGHLLGLGDRGMLKLNENLANASVSRVLFSGAERRRASLHYFNNYLHLEQPDNSLLSYR